MRAKQVQHTKDIRKEENYISNANICYEPNKYMYFTHDKHIVN